MSNSKTWKEYLADIPKNLPQRQDSTLDQLIDLRTIANRFGFYDAADYLRDIVEDAEKAICLSVPNRVIHPLIIVRTFDSERETFDFEDFSDALKFDPPSEDYCICFGSLKIYVRKDNKWSPPLVN